MEAAINRHVRSAFYVKASCTSISHELAPFDIETAACNEPILRHEPFNLMEGGHVVNLVLGLILNASSPSGVPPFCDPVSGPAVLTQLGNSLEAALAYHRSNMAFEHLWGRYSTRCAQLANGKTFSQHIGRGVFQNMDCAANPQCATARLAAPTVEHLSTAIDRSLMQPARCQCRRPLENSGHRENAPRACLPAFMEIFGNDTHVLVEVARRVLSQLPCTGTPSGPAVATNLGALEQATRARAATLQPEEAALYTALTLTTVYHKLVPFCGSTATDERQNEPPICSGTGNNAGTRGTPVVSFTPSTNSERCDGGANGKCVTAAGAVRAYHQLLDAITPVRTRLLGLMFHHKGQSYHYNAPPPTLFAEIQKKLAPMGCDPSLVSLLEDVARLPPMLAEVMPRLYAAENALDLSCIADTREVTLRLNPSGVDTRMRSMLEQAGGDRHMTKDGGGLRVFIEWAAPQPST